MVYRNGSRSSFAPHLAPAAIQSRSSVFSAWPSGLSGGMSSSATFSHSRLSLGFPATNTAPCLPPFNAASRWDKSSFPFRSNPLWHSRQCRISNGATSRSKIAAAKEWPPVDPSKDRINPDKIVWNPRRCIKERCLEKLPEECEDAKRKPSLSKQKKGGFGELNPVKRQSEKKWRRERDSNPR